MALTKIPSSLLDTSGGFDLQGNITLGDNERIQFGDGTDFEIYSDGGSNNYLISNNGALILRNLGDDKDIYLQSDDGSGGFTSYIHAKGSTGEVILKHYGSNKIATSSTGATVTGTLTVTGDLDITGNVNSYNVTDLDVTDQTITLGAGQTEANSGGSGIIIDGSSASILWDETDGRFEMNNDLRVGNGLFFGSQDFYFYRSAADIATLRVGDSGSYKYFSFTDTGTVARFSSAAGAVSLGSGSNDHLLINSSGNVGIGTNSPASLLHLKSTANSVGPTLIFENTNNAQSMNIDYYNNAGAVQSRIGYDEGPAAFSFFSNVSSTAAMYIAYDGKVGIGTTDPQAPLHARNGSSGVSSYTAGTRAIIEGTATTYLTIAAPNTSLSGILFADPDDSDNGFIKYDHSTSGVMSFGAAGSERMRIDTSGNVGIGRTNPLNTLHIYGTGQTTANITDSGNQGGMLRISDSNTTGGAGGGIIFANSQGDNVGKAGFAAIKALLNNGTGNTQGSLAFSTRNAINSSALTERMRIWYNGNIGIATTSQPNATLQVNGSLSKSSGSFTIEHPLESKKDTHNLVHSFVEAPQADNIYRGVVTLVDGSATINLDTEAGMTEGTFVLLNTNTSCFTSNESDWDAVKGSVSGNILTISCQNTSSTATVSWLVIGERHDQHMIDTDWTDENGKVIVEPLKEIELTEE